MAGTLGGGRGRSGAITGINVTPLVDVVLVLLIILMVSSTYIVAQTLKVQLPKASTSDGTADKPFTVSILRTGKLVCNDEEVDEAGLKAQLKTQVAANPDTNLVVSADQDTPYGSVVHVLDLAKAAGIVKFAINVKAGDG